VGPAGPAGRPAALVRVAAGGVAGGVAAGSVAAESVAGGVVACPLHAGLADAVHERRAGVGAAGARAGTALRAVDQLAVVLCALDGEDLGRSNCIML
jgi:hypothetical protein